MHGYVFVDNLQVVIIGLVKFGLIIVEELIRIGIMCLLLIGKPNKPAHHSYYTNRNFDTIKLAFSVNSNNLFASYFLSTEMSSVINCIYNSL